MPYDLDRFLVAQESSYDGALGELRRGRKVGHWIWFIFPQIAGLGRSAMSQRFAIASIDEARAYLAQPVLGATPRVRSDAPGDRGTYGGGDPRADRRREGPVLHDPVPSGRA